MTKEQKAPGGTSVKGPQRGKGRRGRRRGRSPGRRRGRGYRGRRRRRKRVRRQVLRQVQDVEPAVGDDRALPVDVPDVRRVAPERIAGRGVDGAEDAVRREVEDVVRDERRRPRRRLLPLLDERRNAARECQLETGAARAVHDEDPRAAVRGVDPDRRLGEQDVALRDREALELSSDLADRSLSAQVGKIDQAQQSVLAPLHRKSSRELRGGQDRRRRAAEVRVGRLEIRVGRGRVAVERLARAARSVRRNRDHAVSPVMPSGVPVVEPVARPHEDPVRDAVVDDAWPRPHGCLRLGAVRHRRRDDEVDRLVAAVGVEDLLRAVGEVDRRNVPLVVPGVARVAAVDDVEIGRPAGGRREWRAPRRPSRGSP